MTRLHGFFVVLTLYSSCFLITETAWGQVQVQTEQNNIDVVSQSEQQSTLKSMDKSLISEASRQNQIEISRSSQQLLQVLPGPTPIQTEEDFADPLAGVLAFAWEEYDLKNYVRAKELFLQASDAENAEVRESAEYGLAYSYLQLGDTSAALPLLQQFVDQGKQLESTASALAAILFKRGDFAALHALLAKLPPAKAEEWQERMSSARFQQDIISLDGDPAEGDIESFITQYISFLNECKQSELFFRLATKLVDKAPKLSKNLFAYLSKCNQRDHAWQQRVVREQLHLLDNKELLVAASGVSAPSSVRISEQTWKSLLRENLWLRFGRLEQESPEYELIVQAIYALDPQNPEAVSLAAWSCYQRKEYRCAEELFTELLQKMPTDDAALGLVFSLQKQGFLEKALEVVMQYPTENYTTFNELRFDLHVALGGKLYHKKYYKEALVHLEQALVVHPLDKSITEMVLWSQYHLGDRQPLAGYFWQQYRSKGSAENAKSLYDLLDSLNDPVFTRKVMADFAVSDVESVRKLAGDFAYRQQHPVLANQIYQGKSPYAGSADPALSSMFLYRNKSGDEGTSSLNVTTLILKQQVSTTPGRTGSITISPQSINSGTLSDDLSVGTAFRSLQGVEGDPEAWQDHTRVLGWRGGLQIESTADWDIAIGSTPLGGEISPTFVGKVAASGPDWSIAFAQSPVRDSMLSWIGQTDPYSGREWGRIVDTTLFAARTIPLGDGWLSLEGEGAWYRGKNVEENFSLTTSVSGGVTSNWRNFERSTGLFLFARGFNKNSNFYTFGHGGYYSPAAQVVAGPFFRLTTGPSQSYWLDASFSAGINYRKTDDAPYYTELGSLDIDPTDPAWQNLTGEYHGESETGLGLDAKIRGLLPLTGGWFVGGEAAINNVAGFTQWQVAVVLRYRFGEGMGLGLPEKDFSMLTDIVQ